MENYCNSIWPMVYDHYNQGRHQQELAFYGRELAVCEGPVLEVACGTGMIFLPLLTQGLDIYGFDLSAQMLGQLFEKAERDNMGDVRQRVTQQDMIDFEYDMQFGAIFIPARSFLHLATQEDQIASLRNIRRHLREGGKLMLNFFTPSLTSILSRVDQDPCWRKVGQYPHPLGEGVISVTTAQVNDVSEQVQHITWRFEWDDQVVKTPMLVRWIYKKEFELLARIAGFEVAQLYSGFDLTPYDGTGEMVWVLNKA